jgi:hypothetical protein
MSHSESNMKIICVEEHPTDPAADKAARPAVLGEAPYSGLTDSHDAASRPRNHHRPTMMALPECGYRRRPDQAPGRARHPDAGRMSYGPLAQLASVRQAVAFTADTLDGAS